MNLLKGDAKYADVMELTLYNGAISGISIAGDRFFYQNPLASNGAQRSSWIGLSCCPTNLARFIPQVGGFAYAQLKDQVYVNLYMAGEATIRLEDDTTVQLRQTTDYPWSGQIQLTVDPQLPTDLTLCLRIPSWARGRPVPSDLYRFANTKFPPVTLKINDQTVNATIKSDGYVHLKRKWHADDTVELELPMPVQRVCAHEKVEGDDGKVALMRGPIVYCLEADDHDGADVAGMVLPRKVELRTEHRPKLLSGVTVLNGKALIDGQRSIALTAVPYYAWCNREKGAMTVWINEVPVSDR